ncbi:MAG: hypothetical protein WCH78_14565, partial [Bacteroidota bacterium]
MSTTATALNSTPIGNATPSTGAFTSLSGQTLTNTGSATLGLSTATALNATPIGNSSPSTGAFT